MQCPRCSDQEMVLTTEHRMIQYSGVQMEYDMDCYRCPECLLRVGTIEQIDKLQWTILEAFETALETKK